MKSVKNQSRNFKKKMLVYCLLVLLLSLCTLWVMTLLRKPNSAGFHGIAPQKDMQLKIYTTEPQELCSSIVKEFEARTGIWVEVTYGDYSTLRQMNSLKEDYDLIWYQSSEVAQNFIPCYASPTVIIYSPMLVRKNQPNSWDCLMDASWEGKIAFANPADSAISEAAMKSLLSLYQNWAPQKVTDTFLANLAGYYSASDAAVLHDITSGNCYIGVTTKASALKAIAAGMDITLVYPPEGNITVWDGISISSASPAENVLAFLDFLKSEDTQTYLSEHYYIDYVDLLGNTADSESVSTEVTP